MERISTDIFNINAKAISHTLVTLYGKKWFMPTFGVLLPMVLLGAIFDLRWVIVALMILFIVLPMVLAFLFFYYGLDPVSVVNSPPHALEFGDNAITVYIYEMVECSPDTDSSSSSPENKNPDFKTKAIKEIDYCGIKDFIVGLSQVILRTSVPGNGFLIIPLSAFPDKMQFELAISAITSGMKKMKHTAH